MAKLTKARRLIEGKYAYRAIAQAYLDQCEENERLREALRNVSDLESQTRALFDPSDAESLWDALQEALSIAHKALGDTDV